MGFRAYYGKTVEEPIVNQEATKTILDTEDDKRDQGSSSFSTKGTKNYGKKLDLDKYSNINLEEHASTPVPKVKVNLHHRLDHISVPYRDRLNNKQWKADVRKLSKELNHLHSAYATISPVVNLYRHHTEVIDTKLLSSLNAVMELNNRLYNHGINFNQEDGLEGYIEVMNRVLSNTADGTDNLKSEIATLINGFISEINGLKIDKYKEIILKVKTEVTNKSNKTVSAADKLIEAISRLETVNLENIKEVIKTQEYLLSSLGKDDTTVDKAIGSDQGLKTEQINRLADVVMAYYNVAVANPILRDILTSDKKENEIDYKLEILGGALKGFMVDLLPHLNITYKEILYLLRTDNPLIETTPAEQITQALKNTVDEQLVKFIRNVGGFKIEGGIRTNLYHEQGYYILKDDGALYKYSYDPNTNNRIPDMNVEKLLYVSGLLETICVPSNILIQFPKILIALLNSEAMIPNDTVRLFNINLTLGVILGLIGIYRDELVFGIYGLSKALSEVTDGYYNVVKAVENIAKR